MSADTLVVLAHPGGNSLSHLFAEDIVRSAQTSGHKVKLLDLCAEGFDPVLTRAERAGYYQAAPDLAAISAHAADLASAKTLVLVFPAWWFGMPAILKGWIDRVFAPQIAFDHANDFGPIKPRLTRLENVLVITTLGSPWWVDWFVMRRPVRRILKTAVFGLCAPQAKFKMLSFYSAEKPSPAHIEAFCSKVRANFERARL
jgi:NAD(P)H dehydrogenase (quinone)